MRRQQPGGHRLRRRLRLQPDGHVGGQAQGRRVAAQGQELGQVRRGHRRRHLGRQSRVRGARSGLLGNVRLHYVYTT